MRSRIDDLKGVDASFEQLVEAISEAADWDERKTEKLLTEKVVTEFVKFHVEKAEKERLTNKGLGGGTSLKIMNHDHLDAEITEKRAKIREKSPCKPHVNNSAKKRLLELLEREEEAEELNKRERIDARKKFSHGR